MKRSLRFQDVLAAVESPTAALLGRVAERAASEGVGLYLVGGPIRDLLLERPIVDVDLMVDGDAKALAEAVCRDAPEAGLRAVAHTRFGTVRIESEETSLDLAGLRHERYAHPGALPDVEPGTLEQDVARRDFTVNALVCRVDARRPGRGSEILDLCGGLEDLAARRLRVLHPRSFHDDPTRAWRAARLAARLGFSLERRSRAVLRDALRDGAFGSVSGERFRRELVLGFEEARRGAHPGRVLRLLSDWHVLPALEPGLALARDRMLPLRRLGRAVARPDWPTPRWRPWVTGVAIWLAPLPAALRRRTLERFSIRGEQATRIVRFGSDAERALRGLARARGRGAVDATLGDLPEEVVQGLYALAEPAVRRRILRWGAEDRRRRAPVAGADLAAAGLSGAEVGRALARIRSGFLDGEIANREEALALAQELARRAARRPTGRKKSAARGRGRRKPTRRVAAEEGIQDNAAERRRPPARPGNASPQADSSR